MSRALASNLFHAKSNGTSAFHNKYTFCLTEDGRRFRIGAWPSLNNLESAANPYGTIFHPGNDVRIHLSTSCDGFGRIEAIREVREQATQAVVQAGWCLVLVQWYWDVQDLGMPDADAARLPNHSTRVLTTDRQILISSTLHRLAVPRDGLAEGFVWDTERKTLTNTTKLLQKQATRCVRRGAP